LIQVRTDFVKNKVFKADSGDLNQFGEVRTDLDKLKQYKAILTSLGSILIQLRTNFGK
jgi:hypothetical protein